MLRRSFSRLFRALSLVSVLSLAGMSTALADKIPEGWFVWPAVEPVSGSALDVSAMNRVPAGAEGRIRVQDGQFVTPDGKRIRFWGANFSAEQNFPDAQHAKSFARWLAKSGVNIVRLHHMDNPWAVERGGSLWSKDSAVHRDLDPVALDRLHRLIAELKAQGIYVNLNLKVSKKLNAADGFAPSVTEFKDYQKRVDFFQPRMIELQKDYARRLLTAKNPYTGLTLLEDPAVAVVETNNENSLLGYWVRDLGRGIERFPEPFRSELIAQWNSWLATRYADDKALAAAWGLDGNSLGASLVVPTEKWGESAQRGVDLKVLPGKDACSVETLVNIADGTDWHTQAFLGGFNLQDGGSYTLEFEARADKERQMNAVIGVDPLSRPLDAWRSMGLYEPVNLTTQWKPYRLVFIAHSVGGAGARLSLNVGQTTGKVSLRNLRLSPGCVNGGLLAGQSPRKGTVPIPLEPSRTQWADWMAFLAATDRSFADQMRAYLKEELKLQSPLICSQVDYGGLVGLYREQAMEFADSHCYWQHPDFAGDGMWDPSRWTIRNTPQLAEFGERSFGILGSMALIRVAGKPFALSEYDHPAPSEYVCEMYPVLSSFASRQDWDAVYPFVIDDYTATDKDGAIKSFFDQHHHPAKWGFSVFATSVFRHELVASAAPTELQLGSPLWGESPHADVLWAKLIPEGSF